MSRKNEGVRPTNLNLCWTIGSDRDDDDSVEMVGLG